MKKALRFLVAILFCSLLPSAVAYATEELVPSEEEIIAYLEEIPNIIEIAPVTEENDPNGYFGETGGYYAAVYFSVDLVEQEDISGESTIDKGVDAGGCIEAYRDEMSASLRNKYLSKFDKSKLFNSGYHTTLGNLVIRTSRLLPDTIHAQLEENIISALSAHSPIEQIILPKFEESNSTGDAQKITSNKSRIEIPYDNTFFESGDWNIDDTVAYFEELGFINIETITEPSFFTDDIVTHIDIDEGFYNPDGFEAGDTFNYKDTVEIHYYSSDFLLTTENCPDLADLLFDESTYYKTFAEKYDGKYVAFDGYIYYHTDYVVGTGDVYKVCGGDYTSEDPPGNIIILGVDGFDLEKEINYGLDEGQHAIIIGEVNDYRSEYYNSLYIDCKYLFERY